MPQKAYENLVNAITYQAFKDLQSPYSTQARSSAELYFRDNPYEINEKIMQDIYKEGMKRRCKKFNTLMKKNKTE